jgi:hypothetical protein
MSIIAKNITASGIELPDLGGIYIDASSEVDLVEFFTLDRIDSSVDLYDTIYADIIILNDGTRDLTKAESLEHSSVPTVYEIPDTFLDLNDTPTTYSGYGGNIVVVNDNEDGLEYTTFSGICGIFGNQAIETSSEDTSTTTSTTYQQKLRLSISDIPEGKYRIGWFYEWSMSSSNFRFFGRVQLDDSTDLSEIQIRPSESSWEHWHSTSGFKYESLSSGNHTIDIDFKSTHFRKTAGIRRVRLEFWRAP